MSVEVYSLFFDLIVDVVDKPVNRVRIAEIEKSKVRTGMTAETRETRHQEPYFL